jgi:hypothetical protein
MFLNLIKYGQTTVIILLLVLLFYFYNKYQTCNDDIIKGDILLDTQNRAIEQLSDINNTYKAQHEKSRGEIKRIKARGDRDIERVNNLILTNDCEGAIKIGVKEASAL